jgi:hypothetical protein
VVGRRRAARDEIRALVQQHDEAALRLQHLAAHVLRPNEHAFELVGGAVLHGTGPQTSMGSMRSVATRRSWPPACAAMR